MSTKERFMIYASSNCVSYRETAVAHFSHVDVVDTGGNCDGSAGDVVPNAANIVQAPGHVRNAQWRENHKVFGTYRYCLVLEKRNAEGYISEKILNAFLGGCIPIYYGEQFVFKIFNKNAFIYYDINEPQAAINSLRYLELNASAYAEVMAQPILANGDRTVEEFFSLSDEIGNATLKHKIHSVMGLGALR
jgi:hypothetical protein